MLNFQQYLSGADGWIRVWDMANIFNQKVGQSYSAEGGGGSGGGEADSNSSQQSSPDSSPNGETDNEFKLAIWSLCDFRSKDELSHFQN